MLENKIVDVLGNIPTKGDVGIEIETELNRQPAITPKANTFWRADNDGSLRGYSKEWVLKKPCLAKDVSSRLKLLQSSFDYHKMKIKPSIRAGVHIHLNVQQLAVRDVFKLMTVYYPIETVLAKFCGEGREGNLFCLRARDANHIIQCAEWALSFNDLNRIRGDEFRYAALNFQSLFTYGSVEFRGLATESSFDNIEQWVDILLRIKEYALKVDSGWDTLHRISGVGPRQWLEEVVGEKYAKQLDYPDLEDDIIKDSRNIQNLCYEMGQRGF